MHHWAPQSQQNASVSAQLSISRLSGRFARHLLRSRASWLLSFCLLLLASAFISPAQTGTGGTLLGTVTDPSGAVMPSVVVTVTNTDTNQATHLTTNQGGEYVAADLPIGHYVVRAEASGFKVTEQKDITLNVGARTRADLKLEVGSKQEGVNVEATAVAVQSESGEVSDVITGQQVSQLATNGRSIYSLATLTAGASSNMVDFQNPTPVGGDGTVSFNGLRTSHNIYLVDGGEDLDRGGSGNISIMPSIDSIAEFRALTSNFSAEYAPSAAVTLPMVLNSC